MKVKRSANVDGLITGEYNNNDYSSTVLTNKNNSEYPSNKDVVITWTPEMIKGDKGDPGRGIEYIRLVEKRDLISRYEIRYTDNKTDEFYVEDGKSAYEIWLDHGNSGSVFEFLEHFRGFSIKEVKFKKYVEQQGNEYSVIDTNNKEVGTFIAPVGASIEKVEFKGENENGDYLYDVVIKGGVVVSRMTIPRGAQGPKGDTGTISNVTATVNQSVGEPSVTVDVKGTPENREFEFHFENIKGNTGETGPQGIQGVGVRDIIEKSIEENGDRTYALSLTDGSETPSRITSPRGPKGEHFEFKKIYPSIEEMNNDLQNPEIKVGDYVIISSEDNDNAKLYRKSESEFEYLLQLAIKGVGIKDKEFVKEDSQGNYIYRDIYSDGSKSSEYISPRGPRGFTGGTADGEQPPGSVPYGTIIEWGGINVPDGWAYTNGGTLEKCVYPHLSSVLNGVSQPQKPFLLISNELEGLGTEVQGNITKFKYKYPSISSNEYLYLYDTVSHQYYVNNSFSDILHDKGGYGGTTYRGMTEGYYYVELPEKLYLSYIKMNKINAEGKDAYYPSRREVSDYYIIIEYLNDGVWYKGIELYNKTDFIPASESSQYSVSMIKSGFKSNKIRMFIDTHKSNPLFSNNVYPVGNLSIGFDKKGVQFTEQLQLPNIKDSKGRYKIMYVGLPMEPATVSETLYAYDNDYIRTADVPVVESKSLPSYIKGVTESIPKELKLGYVNKFNPETNEWYLEKTYEDTPGYFYDENGDLKYVVNTNKDINEWDKEHHIWKPNKEKVDNKILRLVNQLIHYRSMNEEYNNLDIDSSSITSKIEEITKEISTLKSIIF